MSEFDDELMQKALALGVLGEPSPNPHVGCVIAHGSEVVGEGFHEAVGLDHAEAVALARAGSKARGATLYVTLEPCAMCAGAIAHVRLRRVYYAAEDPKAGAVDHGVRLFCRPPDGRYGGPVQRLGQVEMALVLAPAEVR